MLTTFLCLASALTAPPPKTTAHPHYFPSEVGTKWEWLVSDQKEGEKKPYFLSIDNVEEKAGETIVSLKQHEKDFSLNAGRFKLTKEGVFSLGSKTSFHSDLRTPLVYDPPLPVIKYPVETGMTWQWKGKYGADERSETRTITTIEDVTVTAGTFHAAKVVSVGLRASTGDRKWKITEWYAVGNGRVKIEMDDATTEMTRFTPAKK